MATKYPLPPHPKPPPPALTGGEPSVTDPIGAGDVARAVTPLSWSGELDVKRMMGASTGIPSSDRGIAA